MALTAVAMVAGCASEASHPPAPYDLPGVVSGQPPATDQPLESPTDEQLRALAASIETVMPQTAILTGDAGACGSGGGGVVQVVLNEQVLFDTDSDQPRPGAPAALDFLAGSVRSNAPGAELTVLGHTDAVGSDAYNLDLSKRRALTVLGGLASRGLSPQRLSAVAVGKRQPIAGNTTPEGRARNRRVEFLISPCLAANLGTVKSLQPVRDDLPTADEEASARNPLEVLRLQQTGLDEFALNTVAAVSLNRLYDTGAENPGMRPLPAAPRNVQPPSRASRVLPPVGRISPSQAPEVKLNVPDPAPVPNELGPATSY